MFRSKPTPELPPAHRSIHKAAQLVLHDMPRYHHAPIEGLMHIETLPAQQSASIEDDRLLLSLQGYFANNSKVPPAMRRRYDGALESIGYELLGQLGVVPDDVQVLDPAPPDEIAIRHARITVPLARIDMDIVMRMHREAEMACQLFNDFGRAKKLDEPQSRRANISLSPRLFTELHNPKARHVMRPERLRVLIPRKSAGGIVVNVGEIGEEEAGVLLKELHHAQTRLSNRPLMDKEEAIARVPGVEGISASLHTLFARSGIMIAPEEGGLFREMGERTFRVKLANPVPESTLAEAVKNLNALAVHACALPEGAGFSLNTHLKHWIKGEPEEKFATRPWVMRLLIGDRPAGPPRPDMVTEFSLSIHKYLQGRPTTHASVEDIVTLVGLMEKESKGFAARVQQTDNLLSR